MTNEEALFMLIAADVMFENDEDETVAQALNMNDVWGWATAWGEHVPDDELAEVGRLFRDYGRCGLYYWVSKRHGDMQSEFEDINRFVRFVQHEESIKADVPNSSTRAYAKRSYMIGE